MPNRRQQIKYQGLQAYRQRQAMRRMQGDGRNPYGSKGGYVVSNRQMQDGLMMQDMRAYQQGNYNGSLSDMTMQNQPINHDPYMPRDYAMNNQGMSSQGQRNDYGSGMPYAGVPAFYQQNGQGYDMAMRNQMQNGYDMARRNQMQGGYDGHHYGMQGQGMTYYPVEAMGTFNGYYGMPQQDFARNQGQGGYNQGQNRNVGDYGESLTTEDLEKWCKKLKEQLDEREKSMFSKQAIMQHAKQIGRSVEGFGEKELEVATLMIYTDYKNSIGQNLDLAVRLAFDWLNDKDTAVKGAEKLAIYYDCVVEGDDD